MIKNRFIKNTAWIIFGQVFRMLVSLVIGIITARYLGPSNNGVIHYVSSYIAFFTAIIGLGLNGVVVHEFVTNREEEGKILGTAIWLRFIVGVISLFAFMGMIILIEGNDQTIILVALLQAIQMPFNCFDTINYWYQSHMKSKYSVISQNIAYVVIVIYRIIMLVTEKDVVWFAFGVSLDVIVLSVSYLIFYSRHKTKKLGYSKAIAKRLLTGCLPFILANIMVVIYAQMDRIMIKHLMGSTEKVGLYSAAITICGFISLIPIAILDSGRPLISEAKLESEEKYKLRFKQLAAGIIWTCVLYSAFITLFSKIIIYLLYGEDYLGANVCLKIAVWYTSFSYLGSARSFWLICEDKKKYVFVFSLIGAICNVIMNFAFIPIWGINGAAIATLITQILANFVVPLMFKQTREYGKLVIEAFILKDIQLKDMISLVLKRFKIK